MSPTRPNTSRPGAPIVGAIAIAVGLVIAVAAILAAVVGRDPAARQPATQAAPDSPGGVPDAGSEPQDTQLVESEDGRLSFEAPAGWETRVLVTSTVGGVKTVAVGAVETTFDDYTAAKAEGAVVAVTDPTSPTSAGLMGAIIGNSTFFCPATGCTTGKPVEKDVELPSPATAVDTQFTVSEPETDGAPGELRYTIETKAPTRYIVVVVRAADPDVGADVLEQVVGSLSLR